MSQQFLFLYVLPGAITFIAGILSWLSLQGLPKAGPYTIPQRGKRTGPPKLIPFSLGVLTVSLIPVLNWVGILQLIAYLAERFHREMKKHELHTEVAERLRAVRDIKFRHATQEDFARRIENEKLFAMILRDPNASWLEDPLTKK
jgi:hypothetical protein